MQWNTLLYQLADYGPRYLVEQLSPRDVYGYELITPSAEYNENVLYIGWLSQLPALAESGFAADTPLLCMEDAAAEHPFTNLALLDELVELEAMVQAIVALLADESRTQANTQQLLAAYNSNRGLQHMVDVASEMLGNPLIVADVSYKILAISQRGFSNRPDIELQRDLGYVLAENVSDLKQNHVHEQARKKVKPFYSAKADGDAWMTALVYLNGVEVAHIDVMELSRPFTEGDFALVQFLCGLVSLELQKNDFFKANRGFLHSFFLTELLEGQIPDADVVSLRLQHLNWTPAECMYVMVIGDSQPGAIEGKSKIISQQVGDLLPGSRWAMYDGALVFLLSFNDESGRFVDADGPLDQYLAINGLTAAVSNRYKDLLHTRRHYRQATKALELGRRLDAGRRIYAYPDYLCQHLAEVVSESHDLADFLHPAIPELIRYDKEHKTNLLQTLDQHLRYGDNPTLVASNLFIHRNTLFYRIAKVKELFGLDLSSGDERMKLLLSMKFLQMLGGGSH